MIVKNIIFLFALFLAGCGVMNNPDDDQGTAESIFDDASNLSEEVSMITSASIGEMNIPELDSYRIFETSALTELFLTDLNDSAQTLASGDSAIVKEWIKNINDADINYQNNNFLFYPILQNEDCGSEERVTINDKNATITISASSQACDAASVYHVLMYKVDKSIENIMIQAFGEGTIIISNSAK